jgi:hypothetical protein
MISGITWTHIQSVWNHSGPLFRKPVTGQELFFCSFLQQAGSSAGSEENYYDFLSLSNFSYLLPFR